MKKLILLLLCAVLICGCIEATEQIATEESEEQEEIIEQETLEPEEVFIEINSYSFDPDEITISAGTTVTWLNQHTTGHRMVSGTSGHKDGVFDSGMVYEGNNYSFTFEQPGEYDYYNNVHPFMTGKIIVN